MSSLSIASAENGNTGWLNLNSVIEPLNPKNHFDSRPVYAAAETKSYTEIATDVKDWVLNNKGKSVAK